MSGFIRDAGEAFPAMLFLCLGSIYCFFGYEFLKMLLISGGAAAGMAAGLLMAHQLTGSNGAVMAAMAVLGMLAGGALIAFLYKAGVFMLGFAVGSLAAPMVVWRLQADVGDHGLAIASLLLGICCGLGALYSQRWVLIGFTAAFGAIAMVTFGGLLATGAATDYRFSLWLLEKAYPKVVRGYWWLIVILTVSGVLVQARRAGKSPSE